MGLERNLIHLKGVEKICSDDDLSEILDCNKMAIMGWSYGGYASAMALAREDSPFQCGIRNR